MPEWAGLTSARISDSKGATDERTVGHGPVINLLGVGPQNLFPHSIIRPFIYLS